MKISCPSCQAKYSIADEKVANRLAKIRCRKCGAAIVIDGKVSPPHVYATAGDAADVASVDQDAGGTGSQYSVDFGEGDQRTMSVAELVSAYNAGHVTADTYLWAEGFADWKPLAEVEEVVEALHAAADQQEPAPSPWGASPAPRAAARSSRRGATDLFGGIEHAGSEDEVTTSAPEPAPTGARNESSVLFSLSALTSAASRTAPTRQSTRPTPGTASRDDSGLIDLKALTAAATRSEAAAAAVPVEQPLVVGPALGLAPPLGIPAPLGGLSATAQAPVAAKNKNGLYIGVGVTVAALVIAGAILLRPQPPPPPPPPAVAIAPTAVPAPLPPPAASDTTATTAQPPATGTAEAADKAPKPAAAPVRRYYPPVSAKKAPAAATPASEPAAAPAAAPKPKRSSCGCSPGDLQCAMRCAAGR